MVFMLGNSDPRYNRREFIQTGAVATAGAVALAGSTAGRSVAQDAPADDAKAVVIPTRPLGKTGINVPIVNLGTWRHSGLDRILRFGYASGIRYVDTAKSYGSEPGIGRWLTQFPEVRKEIFLVTKDHPATPKQLIKQLDERLAALKTDYVDLIFIHGIGNSYGEDYASLDWPKSKEFKETVEAIKKSGKAKLVGFSTHDSRKAEYLQAAAEGGFVDAIMVQFSPWLGKDHPLNKAIDACHKKGIGIISMKQVAGAGDKILEEVPKNVPVLKERGLNAYQGLLTAIWSDERIASTCVSMRSTEQIREDTSAAAKFEPLKTADIMRLRDAFLASGPTFCKDCDASCSRAAGTTARLDDLTRLITYHDQYGYRGEARRLYAAMADHEKNWAGADLEAATHACPNKLNFAGLLAKVERDLA